MRAFFVLVGLLILNINISSAQLRVDIENSEYIDNSTIRVIANIQNLGSATTAFIPYGNMATNINPNQDSRKIDVLLNYRPVGEQKYRKKLASSVLVKTWFGTNIEAEMMQEIRSTGSTNQYVWEIIFSVPPNALDVSVNVLGVTKEFPDRQSVVLKEKSQQNKAEKLITVADSLFNNSQYEKAITKYSEAERNNSEILEKINSNYAVALYKTGLNEYKNEDFNQASEYFLQAHKIASQFDLDSKSKISKKLSETYIVLGDKEFQDKSYGNAKFFYEQSNSLNLKDDVTQNRLNKINTLKRNPTTATFLSIIPGGGQFYNKKYTEGSLFMAGGLLFGTAAIINPEKARNAIYFYAALSVWSMFRASSQANAFNESLNNYNSGLNKFKVAVVPNRKGINLAFRLSF